MAGYGWQQWLYDDDDDDGAFYIFVIMLEPIDITAARKKSIASQTTSCKKV